MAGAAQETGDAARASAKTGAKRKGSPLESGRKSEAPGTVPQVPPELPAEAELDLAASLLLRRAAGKHFESSQVVQRLKAAQRGMVAASRASPFGTDNQLADLEHTQFRYERIYSAQRDVASMLCDALYAQNPDSNEHALRDCWPEALLDDVNSSDSQGQDSRILLRYIADHAMSRLTGVQNCPEKTLENVACHDAAILEGRTEEDSTAPSTTDLGSFVLVAAGDHVWLEVRHSGRAGNGSEGLVARPDDLIIDTWTGDRKVPQFREDAVYPASARATTRCTIPKVLAEKLPGYIDKFVNNLVACPTVISLCSEKSAAPSSRESVAANLRMLEQEKLPVSSSLGIYPHLPHPLRPEVRAAARKGLAGFNRDSKRPWHAEIVATRIARDLDLGIGSVLGMGVWEAARRAPRIVEIANEMAAEPVQRRLIAGDESVFDDSKPPQPPGDIIGSLNGLGHDIRKLHTALWHLEDALLVADAQTLKDNVAALRAWWWKADVPLPIHAHVFDILANDRIGDAHDFSQLMEMIMKLPVLAHSEAMLERATLFLSQALVASPPSFEDAQLFDSVARSQIEDDCKALGEGLSQHSRQKIERILSLATGPLNHPPSLPADL